MECIVPAQFFEEARETFMGEEERLVDKLISTVPKSKTSAKAKNDLPDPIDYLKAVMKERGLRNKDLKIYIGSSGNVSSILHRRKPLSLRMIRNLHDYLGIPAEILIQPYKCH